jgi:hypothetical protein
MLTVPQVELSMAYGCNVSQTQILKYIHHNRHHNTMLIDALNHTIRKNNENNENQRAAIQALQDTVEKLNATFLQKSSGIHLQLSEIISLTCI